MNSLRSLPSIDRLLQSEPVARLLELYPRPRVVEALRVAVQEVRQQRPGPSIEERAAQALARDEEPSLRPVINATGVILHTNLGRAPLSQQALRRVLEACGYCNLEMDLASGERGSRHDHVRRLLTRLSGAESALVVNNCAAAMMLLVDELARGREVIVSRGELVEIGGSFRVPDVLARGGARLVEVGTTNRTYVSDYRKAVNENTGMLLSTHLSNFRMSGFTVAPDPAELTALGRELGLPTVLDLGSGLLAEAPLDEPGVRAMVRAGFDLVAFSGDKLLGASQAGIVVGRQPLIARLAKNPWMRALRPDKLTLAALEGTLLDYLQDPGRVPVVAMLTEPAEKVNKRARKLARKLAELPADVEVVASRASVGGGSAPQQELDSFAVRLTPREASEEAWAATLRRLGVVARRQAGALVLDLRTVPEDQVERLAVACRSLA